jgi:hypothetical protein
MAWLAGRLRRARTAREAPADEETAELTCLRGPAIKKLMADGGPRQLSLFDEQDLAEISCWCCLPASSGCRSHVRQGSPPLRDHTEPAGHDRDRGTSARPLTGWLQGDRQHGAGTPKQRLGPLILAIRRMARAWRKRSGPVLAFGAEVDDGDLAGQGTDDAPGGNVQSETASIAMTPSNRLPKHPGIRVGQIRAFTSRRLVTVLSGTAEKATLLFISSKCTNINSTIPRQAPPTITDNKVALKRLSRSPAQACCCGVLVAWIAATDSRCAHGRSGVRHGERNVEDQDVSVVVSRPAWVLPVLTRTRTSRSGKIPFRKLPSRQTSGRVRLPCLSWDTSTATVAPGASRRAKPENRCRASAR